MYPLTEPLVCGDASHFEETKFCIHSKFITLGKEPTTTTFPHGFNNLLNTVNIFLEFPFEKIKAKGCPLKQAERDAPMKEKHIGGNESKVIFYEGLEEFGREVTVANSGIALFFRLGDLASTLARCGRTDKQSNVPTSNTVRGGVLEP